MYVYEFDGASLNLISTLDGPFNRDQFGAAVAMTPDGNRLLVGAPGPAGSGAGAVCYYEWNGVDWDLLLPIVGTSDGDNLGTSVAILSSDGNTLAMGAPNVNGNRGAVRVYRRLSDSSFWQQLGADIVGEEEGEFLGATLSARVDNQVVTGTATGTFLVFEFDEPQQTWVRVGPSGGPSFGAEVTSISSSNNGDVAIGVASEETVVLYGL